jgi:class 3 adenylate cyclase/predicted ATPase
MNMPGKGRSAETEDGLKRWLEGIGLGHHADLFLRHRIDFDVMPDLTNTDLSELGLPLGDRKRFQRAMASLVGTPSSESSANDASTPLRAAVAAERRQLTVMFCDMVGSTSLSEQFDPEDVRDIIASFRETCVRLVKNYDGFAARYVGDGILFYFGYPNAHEDDAERAVRAGLEIVHALSTQAEQSRDAAPHAPAVRIGIATGLAVVGDLIGEDTEEHDSAVGETLNLAARLQSLAPPNGVVIASSTQSLLKGKFDYKNLGFHTLKGISEEVQAWHVVRPSRVESRFAAAMGAKLTPLVNRVEEIALLQVRWQQAKEGDGQVVLLSGEPGIGKSRIVQELRDRVAGERHGHISFQCSPYYSSTAFYPFVEQLTFALGIDREDASTLSLSNLEAALAAANGDVKRLTPIFAALLSIPLDDRYAPLDLSRQQQKDATIVALVNHLIGLACDQPLVIAFEDAHWIDPTSREVLDLLVDKIQDTSILVVITCRSEFQPSWDANYHVTTLTLNRLSRQQRATLVERVVGTELPNEIIEEIIVKTDGVPLFVEELTKAVIESDLLTEKQGRYVFSGPWRQLAIPATLTDSLMARLDRMGPFKKIAQIGATIGREFSYEILGAVAETPPDQISAALNHLEEAGLIVRRGHPPDAVYSFKHEMIRNAAHSSLLHSERRKLHSKIAFALAEMYPERTEREPELLAYHFTESAQSKAAVGFWLKAGKQAAKAGANLEAIAHLRRGLGVVQDNPNVPGRDQMELELRIALGNALIAGKGYAVQDVEENFVRARELGEQLGDEGRVFTATRGLWVCHFIRADLTNAYGLSTKLLKFAKKYPNATAQQAHQKIGYLIEAHRAMAMTMFYRGQFVVSRQHFQKAIALYNPDLHGDLTDKHGIDPGVVSLSYLGYLLWFLGRPEMARQYSRQAISDAEKLRHPFTLAFALEFGAYLCQHLRDVEGTRDYANRAMVISSEHGFLHWKLQAAILRGWALAESGQIDEGLNEMRSALNEYEAMGSWLASCWFRSLLANAYTRAGRPDAALRALDDALAIAKRTGDHFFLAEIYRLQGEITLAHNESGSTGEAEELFHRSLEVARKQKALSWELRTAVSLARLWRGAGKRQQAADLLSPIGGKFKEGFLTSDLREAVQLMNELGVSSPDSVHPRAGSGLSDRAAAHKDS